MQDGKKHRWWQGVGEIRRIFSVFHNAHHLDAFSVRQLIVSAHRVGYGAKNPTGKLPVEHRHARRIFVVMPREVSARQQSRAGRAEVFGRDAEYHGISSGI